MGLRVKIAILFVISFGVIIFFTLTLHHEKLKNSFSAIERQVATDQMRQLTRGLNNELDKLNQATYDWANRDDTYVYLQHPAGNFSDKINAATLKNIDVNFIALLDTQGATVFSEAINLTTGESENPSRFDGTSTEVKKRIASSAATTDRACGLAMAYTGPALVCWQSVRKTDLTGAPVGTLILERPLDGALISKIQKQNGIKFELSPLGSLSGSGGSGTLTADAAKPLALTKDLSDPAQIEFSNTEPNVLTAVLYNITGEPALKARLDFPRTISADSSGLVWDEILRMVIVTALIGVALFFCLSLFIFSRLQKMGVELKSIWRNGRWAERVSTSKQPDDITELGHAINRMLGLIRTQTQELDTIAYTDALTQIANQRAFEQRILIELSLHKRNNAALSLMLIDIDHFKLYNDLYGHPAGDEILIQIARLLAQVACRPSDLPARISEEEFAVILPSTSLDGALHVAETLKSKLAKMQIPHANSPISEFLTLSIGVTAAGDEDLASLMHRIEKAHTQARETGRNKICALASDSKPQATLA